MITTLLVAVALLAPPVLPADLVIENARIWSDGIAGFEPFAAVQGGRFVYVGPTDAQWIGARTVRIDAAHRVVLPGLIDSHVHMLGGGSGLAQIQLRDVADKAEFIRTVAKWSQSLRPGKWIEGGRWSVESWESLEAPTKEWIDAVTGDHPAFLERMDGHSALVNSAALRLAGITKDGPDDPVGGVIDRDPHSGEPTGILRESAMSLVTRFIPQPSTEDRVEAIRAAMKHALANGITSVSDIPGMGDLPAYERLAGDSALPMRLFLYPTAEDWTRAAALVRRFQARPGWIEVRGLKAYLDGSLGSRTAMMREPFLNNPPDKPNWRGLFQDGVEDGAFARSVAAARAAGLQVIVHAIGDEANDFLLNTLDGAFPDTRRARCRSEHAQHLLPEDIQRFGDMGVIASMQPFHKADDGRYAEAIIGSVRSKSSYAYRSLINAGAVVSFGSDWPVVTINPFLGVEAAVTGRTLAGDIWQPQETITVSEALRCYTSRAAYAMRKDDELGRIAPGYRADFVILNNSPFDHDPDWSAIRPLAVYVEGIRRYEAAP